MSGGWPIFQKGGGLQKGGIKYKGGGQTPLPTMLHCQNLKKIISLKKETVSVKLNQKGHKCEQLTKSFKKFNLRVISGPELAKDTNSGGRVLIEKQPGL